MRPIWALLLLIGLALPTQAQQGGTIFVVRHAEKESEADDARLSGAGLRRAECLAETLKEAKIATVIVTPYERTRQTAAQVLQQSKAKEIAIAQKSYAEIVNTGRTAARHGNVLIVGHSNTIPDLMKAFGVESGVAVPGSAYDLLFVLEAERSNQVLTLHYCPALAAPNKVDSPNSMAK